MDYLLWDGTRLLMWATFVLTDLNLMYHIKGMAFHKYKILHVDPVLILFPRDVIHKAWQSIMSYNVLMQTHRAWASRLLKNVTSGECMQATHDCVYLMNACGSLMLAPINPCLGLIILHLHLFHVPFHVLFHSMFCSTFHSAFRVLHATRHLLPVTPASATNYFRSHTIMPIPFLKKKDAKQVYHEGCMWYMNHAIHVAHLKKKKNLAVRQLSGLVLLWCFFVQLGMLFSADHKQVKRHTCVTHEPLLSCSRVKLWVRVC